MQIRLRRHEIGHGGALVIAGTAPKIQLPGESQRRGVGGEAEAVEARTRLDGVTSQSTQGSSDPRVRGLARAARVGVGLHLREKIRPGYARLGSGLFDPGDGLHQVEVGDERRVDQCVERRVIEVVPPLDRGVHTCGLRLQEGFGQIRRRLGKFRLRGERAARRGQEDEGNTSWRVDLRPNVFHHGHLFDGKDSWGPGDTTVCRPLSEGLL